MPPIDIQAQEIARARRKEISEKLSIKEESLSRCQDRWTEVNSVGQLNKKLMPYLNTGQVCFETYLHRLEKRGSPRCHYCTQTDILNAIIGNMNGEWPM